MIKKQTIKTLFFALIAGAMVLPAILPTAVQAACGGVDTAIVNCPQNGEGGTIEDTGLWGILIIAINILTGLVAVAALGGLDYGAVLYTSAGGSSEQVKKAMGIITNVVIGILAYALMYVGLNFLVPGGVFN